MQDSCHAARPLPPVELSRLTLAGLFRTSFSGPLFHSIRSHHFRTSLTLDPLGNPFPQSFFLWVEELLSLKILFFSLASRTTATPPYGAPKAHPTFLPVFLLRPCVFSLCPSYGKCFFFLRNPSSIQVTKVIRSFANGFSAATFTTPAPDNVLHGRPTLPHVRAPFWRKEAVASFNEGEGRA